MMKTVANFVHRFVSLRARLWTINAVLQKAVAPSSLSPWERLEVRGKGPFASLPLTMPLHSVAPSCSQLHQNIFVSPRSAVSR
jgi:hypothetical protein